MEDKKFMTKEEMKEVCKKINNGDLVKFIYNGITIKRYVFINEDKSIVYDDILICNSEYHLGSGITYIEIIQTASFENNTVSQENIDNFKKDYVKQFHLIPDDDTIRKHLNMLKDIEGDNKYDSFNKEFIKSIISDLSYNNNLRDYDTKRLEIATMAMQGLLASDILKEILIVADKDGKDPVDILIDKSFNIADVMLKKWKEDKK